MCRSLRYLSSFLQTNTLENITQECVICLDKEHETDQLLHIDKYMYDRKCKCNYYIHKTCFQKWCSSEYFNENSKEMNCIICNSTGKLHPRIYNNSYIASKNENDFCEMILFFIYYYIH